MSDNPDAVVTAIPDRRNLWARNKTRFAKIGAVTGAVILGGVVLKRKLNCSCDVDANANLSVESDKTDN